MIFSSIRRLGPFCGVQHFEFQYFLGGFHKNEYFWGMMKLWIFLLGHHKTRLFLGIFSIHFRAFS